MVFPAPTASHAAIALLATRGKSGKWNAPIPAPLAAELYDVIRVNSVPDSLSVPAIALRKAGCDLSKWDIAVQSSQGGIIAKEMAGGTGYVVPTHQAEGQYILSTLEQWKKPEWHLSHKDELAAAQSGNAR